MKELFVKLMLVLTLSGCAVDRALAQDARPLIVHAGSFTQADATTQLESAWEKFSPAGGGFSVLMPGKPTAKDQEVETNLGKLINHMYTLSASPNLYMVTYAEFPTRVTDPAVIKAMLDNARDKAVSATGGELKNQKEVKLGENLGREWLVTIPSLGGIARARAYWVDHGLYQILVLSPADKNPAAEKSREATMLKFLDSFVLTGDPVP